MKKVTEIQVYVHLDPITNAITSRGISLEDFQHSISLIPQNILLLSSNDLVGEFEPHTGLRMIRGEQEITQFFNRLESTNHNTLKWIDFKDLQILRQLSAMEIAELLYFSHMKKQLHSPFFYKLQNEYVFFEQEKAVGRVYYRHLEEFYKVLQFKIESTVAKQLNSKKFFFQQKIVLKSMGTDFLKEVKNILQEGVVFDFSQRDFVEGHYQVPIYIVEDQVRERDIQRLKKEDKIGEIVYSLEEEVWTFNLNELTNTL